MRFRVSASDAGNHRWIRRTHAAAASPYVKDKHQPSVNSDLLRALFDGVRVDVRTKSITAYKPKSDFRAIFAATFEEVGQGWYGATKNGLTAIDNQTVYTEVTGIAGA